MSLVDEIEDLKREVERLKSAEKGVWVYPYSPGWVGTAGQPLTSTSWDGDSFSTTSKTLIDLSAVFGVPAYVKAVLVRTEVRDSASAGSDVYMFLSPNNSASVGLMCSCAGLGNDYRARDTHIIPCDANGDIYYQIVASGAGTFDVKIEIWGYQL